MKQKLKGDRQICKFYLKFLKLSSQLIDRLHTHTQSVRLDDLYNTIN